MEFGGWLVAASAAVALVTALPLRRRLPTQAVAVILGLAGAGLAWGGMLIQPDPSTGEFVAAVAMLTVLLPMHAWVVLGPFGPQ